ncbi:glycerol-3-phosphate dehydrogenase C-terminal domain-containing protein [Saccharopolyspora sp.]|uniref:glycerol-3-phosphate dehydrogenase C-terminal domain-containing protein n=1 Tax=Saccharopolyspora sp. TaxID=33915 RepID=UPI00345C86AE
MDLTAAEVLWAVRHEGALETEDVLDRRSRIGLRRDRRERAQPAVAELVDKALHGVLA